MKNDFKINEYIICLKDYLDEFTKNNIYIK